MTRHAWGAAAIAFGIWEAAAFMFQPVPTITHACSTARRKNRHLMDAGILLFCIGLSRHLRREE